MWWSELFGVLGKLFGAPAAVVATVLTTVADFLWNVLWLAFALVIVCISGPEGFAWVSASVLPGVARKSKVLPALGQGPSASWFLKALPVITWTLISVILVKRFVLS